ncbi:hypothetical protein CUD01_24600 [Cellulomonas uda]|uniref:Uncharacterized protein n=1 Tax=Cellulomonas uda TaxID=1714 RepID=A0A4Y3KEE2_CELUD|nr:hypothetical protein CUD01_24600 [Cellulomonas uda]
MVEAMGPAPEKASEAVETETPAAEATSASVGRWDDSGHLRRAAR